MEKTRGAKAKEARLAKGLLLKEVGHLVGRSEGWVSKFEDDLIENPRMGILARMAKVLDLPELAPPGSVPEDEPLRANSSVLDEHTRQMAEIGERVVSMVEQRRNIVPGPQIRPVKGGSFRLAIVNNLSAAQLSSDIREVATWLDVPEYLLKGAVEPLGFIVVGDCLREKWGIRTGDTLIVDAHNKRPRDGEIVAALINDEDRTAKEFWRVPDGVDLRPTTPGYDVIEIRGETQLVIIGVYVNHLTTGDRNVY
jgi:SOS-response transcriptional repressor LexA